MPNLEKIVCLINDSIKNNAFPSQPFETAQFHGIARDRSNTEKNGWTMPMVVDNDDNGSFVSPDDTYPLVIYHRSENPEYTDNRKTDFGNPGTWMEVKYPMQLICFGDRKKIKKQQEDVMDVMIYNFPREFTNAVLSPLGIQDCVIDTNGTLNDNLTVWNQEFKNVEFPLENNQFIFSIRYTVKMTYKCFNLCQ